MRRPDDLRREIAQAYGHGVERLPHGGELARHPAVADAGPQVATPQLARGVHEARERPIDRAHRDDDQSGADDEREDEDPEHVARPLVGPLPELGGGRGECRGLALGEGDDRRRHLLRDRMGGVRLPLRLLPPPDVVQGMGPGELDLEVREESRQALDLLHLAGRAGQLAVLVPQLLGPGRGLGEPALRLRAPVHEVSLARQDDLEDRALELIAKPHPSPQLGEPEVDLLREVAQRPDAEEARPEEADEEDRERGDQTAADCVDHVPDSRLTSPIESPAIRPIAKGLPTASPFSSNAIVPVAPETVGRREPISAR